MIPQQNVILADGGSDMELNSFDDSEQFEEDSVYSWGSENNQMYNWSIWKASLPQAQRGGDQKLGVRMKVLFIQIINGKMLQWCCSVTMKVQYLVNGYKRNLFM